MKYISILFILCFFAIHQMNAQKTVDDIGKSLLTAFKTENTDTLKNLFLSFDDIIKSNKIHKLPELTQVDLDTIAARQAVHFAIFSSRIDAIRKKGKVANFDWDKAFIHHIDHTKTDEISYRGNTKIITDFYQIDFYFSDGTIALAIYIQEAIGVGDEIKLVTIKDWVYGFL